MGLDSEVSILICLTVCPEFSIKRRIYLLSALLFGLASTWLFPSSSRADSGPPVSPLAWQQDGRKIWVFEVGLVDFEHKDVFDAFDAKGRRDVRLAKFFSDRGVPASHIVYLRDQQAQQKKIGPALVGLLRQTSPGDTLFLYYEGHGYRDESDDGNKSPDGYFAAYDTDNDEVPGWSIDSICPIINKYFRGSRAFLTADCCYSGYLAQTVRQQKGPIAYACIASSSAREESTGNWTFTDCLLDALKGMPFVDLNGNGVVTMAELATFAHSEMSLAEEQHSTFALAGDFPPDAIIARSRPKVPAPIGQRVKVKYGTDWLTGRILATKQGEYLVQCIGYDDPPDWFDTNDSTQMRAIRPMRTFPVGSLVDVKWKGDWYPAKVLKEEGGVHFIHYLADDSSWDEWVPSSRIRSTK